ncbi:hypothetical protein RFI_24550 [Reticulomyxa filosa]|uniref:Uncharacterized protein n=1 Tax=Reticulomyxa filosa TaxID=46433 RepID=X6MID9_RETFI|nr:hypothetical protein RFI_24550 [Reticulomyxa filosa]|eukprot:ETO12825.1 hypothetical protein RFI_24550 [Reticulomyxa filosa]
MEIAFASYFVSFATFPFLLRLGMDLILLLLLPNSFPPHEGKKGGKKNLVLTEKIILYITILSCFSKTLKKLLNCSKNKLLILNTFFGVIKTKIMKKVIIVDVFKKVDQVLTFMEKVIF